MKKIRVGVVFGGTNSEHEVSIVSAKAILDNLDSTKYEVLPIKITKENTWVSPKNIEASYIPVLNSGIVSGDKSLDTVEDIFEDHTLDVIFPVLHGPYGEDGTIQGMLELMRIPYVGCGVASSAVCMDKVLQKMVCKAHGIPMPPSYYFTKTEWEKDQKKVLDEVQKELGEFPLFVKPANQGSSVGVTKAHNVNELIHGIADALTRDLKILVEKAIPNAREIEVSVLGRTDNPRVSVLGEVMPGNEFYDYNAKYLADNSDVVIPADLPKEIESKVRDVAKKVFQILDCWGLARIDFLVDGKTHEYYLSEVNTMPGFTPISMYPKLWEATGLSYKDLLTELIDLALTRHKERLSLNLSIESQSSLPE